MALTLSPARARARTSPSGMRLLIAATPLLRLVVVVVLTALGFVALVSDARGAGTGASGGVLQVTWRGGAVEPE
ncbi:MAG TPA: hypothetical protein VMV46_06075 [Thermoanaerobaculia bacterium]|nr:hypothetical protein [Thermoanaerobaculia bacterium]